MKVRVLAGVDQVQVLRALDDPEVESVVVHKPGSHLRFDDGREMVVTAAGELVAAR